MEEEQASERKKILYFIQLPPPVHGVSVINELLHTSSIINERFETILIEIKFSERVSELRKISFRKIVKFFILSFKLIFTIVKTNPDLVYFSLMPIGKGLFRDAFFTLLIKLFNKKIIFHLHNIGISKNSKKLFYRVLYSFIFNNTDIIHLTKKTIEEEFALLNLKNVRFHLVPNGIPSKNFKTVNKKIKNRIQILFLSNLFIEKGVFILLDAFKKICIDYPNIYLAIVGAEVDYNGILINKYIKEKGLINRVIYHGPVYDNEKKMILEDSDIFVFPSYFDEECFPLAILEAMDARLPIVASDIGAIKEIIDNGINGFIIPSQNSNLLIKSILQLVDNLDLRTNFGEKAHEKFKTYYTYDIFQNNILKILTHLL